ncbi:hypothetical protein Poli38472_003275 [Pythium oligandrum]|uniref:HTH CENPB-type domain-containing protein n=1 Tax=Pythium oligandrum TaxID=41045 RepID=A0A8K1C6Q9_PYTOL|nr:hypothetical protein Poli38472_003275 [Pythium oligandrum]|eukprot:TMW57350.1 hypothetical protein Poli38472_003275 [Pythium oligandrum]
MDAFQLGKPPSERTIMYICKHESVWVEEKASNSKRRMDEAFRAFDEALATWVRERIEKQERLSGAMIKRKARALSDAMQTTKKVKFSNGWLCSFQQRHGFHTKRRKLLEPGRHERRRTPLTPLNRVAESSKHRLV